MACGSVAQADAAIGRDLTSLSLTRSDLSSSSSNDSDPSNRTRLPLTRSDDVHEAISFLQKEHSEVLSGLHREVEELQQKCDDLQFELHLRHVTSSKEDTLNSKLTEISKISEERQKEIDRLKKQLRQRQSAAEEERQQTRWREVQLEQKLKVSEQRGLDLKLEMTKLKGQAHSLKTYCSSLRKALGRTTKREEQMTVARSFSLGREVPSSRKSSIDSLNLSGYKDLPEDHDRKVKKEMNLEPMMNPAAEAVVQDDLNLSKSIGTSSLLSNSFSSMKSLQLQSSTHSFLPPLESRPSTRPSSSAVTLPPITKNASQPQFGRQLRHLSAPATDAPSSRRRNSRQNDQQSS